MLFSTFRWLNYAIFLVVAASLVTIFVFLLPLPFLGIAVVALLMSLGILLWSMGRYQSMLNAHQGSIPMPGIWGLLGVDIYDNTDHDPPGYRAPSAVTTPRCRKCGLTTQQGQEYCSNCGEPISFRTWIPDPSDVSDR